MINSFGCKHTQCVWQGKPTKKWSTEICHVALRKLFMINAAKTIRDLEIPTSNRLHKMKGDLDGYWSVSINTQWRIIFQWKNESVTDVQIIDYH